MGTLLEGAYQAVYNCINLKANENLVIITDEQTLTIGETIKKVSEELTSYIRFFIMEQFGKRPIKFPQEIGEALSQAQASFYVAQSVKDELFMFRKPMFSIIDAKRIRHAHMIGINEQIMKEGMCADYKIVREVTEKVYKKVVNSNEIKVTSSSGTEVVVKLTPQHHWVICDGFIREGHWSNLPDGEVYTSPKSVDGYLVIDGSIGDFFNNKYGLLKEYPIKLELKNGRVIPGSIRCDNKELEKEFSEYILNSDENSSRIGEFAIGTNIFLKRLIGNLLQDEKFPSVHIAFGSPIPSTTKADWDSKIHVDGVITQVTVTVDGELIMKGGEFVNL